MWGAIIGDLAGSVHEYNQINCITPVRINDLISESSFYTDDTILTIAILNAILNDQNYDYYLRKYIQDYKEYKPNINPYFKSIFSKKLIEWADGSNIEKSIGNNALARISPIAYLFDREEDVRENVINATIPSHNSKEALDSATIVAMVIYLARQGYSKPEIISKLKLNIRYDKFTKFNLSCASTINNVLFAVLTSSTFTEAISKVISFGGNTGTNACIVGSMAESLYGIPDKLIYEAKEKLPLEFTSKLDEGYKRVRLIK